MKIKVWLPAPMAFVKNLWMTAPIPPVSLDILMTAQEMAIAVLKVGSVTALQTVKIRLTAAISPVMIMMAVTVLEEMIFMKVEKSAKCILAG